YHGQMIPAGSALLLMLASANRDERRFDDPDRYDLHRDIGQHLTFGYGAHYCLGAALARLEACIALEEVLNRFPEWEIDLENARPAPASPVRGWDSTLASIGGSASALHPGGSGAAVHVEGLPRTEAGGFRGEEEDAVADLLGLAETARCVRHADGIRVEAVPLGVLEQGGGADGSDPDRVHPPTLASPRSSHRD